VAHKQRTGLSFDSIQPTGSLSCMKLDIRSLHLKTAVTGLQECIWQQELETLACDHVPER
jgi:hypothetical protein